MAKHTRGPWFVEYVGLYPAVYGDEGSTEVADCKINGIPEERANAYLIAAAPELLEAAINAVGNARPVSNLESSGIVITAESYYDLIQAILKAKGGKI